MYLIAGLGNPGPEYKDTRHNIGFKVIDLWSNELGVRLTGHRFQSKNILARFENKKVALLCPLTFMNQSGNSIRAFADYYDLESKNILIIHDDVDLPVGKIKIVRKGGAGGHKGIVSIIQHLGSMQFPRIKIGIGRPRYEKSVENYVLTPFYSDQKDIIERAIHMAANACKLFISEGIESAMTKINYQDLSNKEERN